MAFLVVEVRLFIDIDCLFVEAECNIDYYYIEIDLFGCNIDLGQFD
jgi:hypothetical protein